jgi:hypothetical protein
MRSTWRTQGAVGPRGFFLHLARITNAGRLWSEYRRIIHAVKRKASKATLVENCERYLWSRSDVKQLKDDTRRGFQRAE